jgi:predicted aspartyl protease
MSMLSLGDTPFSSGRAEYEDALPQNPGRASIYVRVTVEGMEQPFLALLDTGAEYSVLAREIAEEVGLDAADGQDTALSYRGGIARGRLVRTNVRVLADEGDDLVVDATVFIPDEHWPTGRNFIGYTGFLERIRVGLDPQNNDIYFGGYE